MVIFGNKANRISLQMVVFILKKSVQHIKNPFKAIKITGNVLKTRVLVYGNPRILKFATDGNRYFYTSDNPGWPSKAYEDFIVEEIKHHSSNDLLKKALQTAIVSITSNCPLACEHCYESKYIGTGVQLSLIQLQDIISMLYNHGARHIQLSGGEPLSRFDDLLSLIGNSNPGIDFWLLTSGFGLNQEKALRLKKAGLTGMHISLDHFEEEKHNKFRGNNSSFQKVLEAIHYCNNAGIMVSLSLTATTDFINHENMQSYWELAKRHNCGFIRVLEPRAVGRYEKTNTVLSNIQIEILEDFYLRSIADKKYLNYPIIDYPGYHQRRAGCLGAGNRYLYIDSEGNFHACPFCQNSAGHVNNTSLEEARAKLQLRACHAFEQGMI